MTVSSKLLIQSNAIKFKQQLSVDKKTRGRVRAEFLPARRYASAGLCDSDVSVRLSVRPSVRLSHAGIVTSRAKAGS